MRLAAVLIFLLMAGCGSKNDGPSANLNRMHWLLGDWTRTNNKPGHTGWESWSAFSDTEWRGHSGTLDGTDTIFHEVTKILAEEGRLFFVADVPENTDPVRFEITLVTDSSFTCENQKHDFPKKIYYRFDGAVLHARVSAGDEGIDFKFERR